MEPDEEAGASARTSGLQLGARASKESRLALRRNLAAAAAAQGEAGDGRDDEGRLSCAREIDEDLVWSNSARSTMQELDGDLRESSGPATLDAGRDLLGRRSNRPSTNGSIASVGRISTGRFSGRFQTSEREERVSFRRITGNRHSTRTGTQDGARDSHRSTRDDEGGGDQRLTYEAADDDLSCLVGNPVVGNTGSLLEATGRRGAPTSVDEDMSIFEELPQARDTKGGGRRMPRPLAMRRYPGLGGQAAGRGLSGAGAPSSFMASACYGSQKLSTLQSIGTVISNPGSEGYESPDEAVPTESIPTEGHLEGICSGSCSPTSRNSSEAGMSPLASKEPSEAGDACQVEVEPGASIASLPRAPAPPRAAKSGSVSPLQLQREREAACAATVQAGDGASSGAHSSSSAAYVIASPRAAPAADVLQERGSVSSDDPIPPRGPRAPAGSLPLKVVQSRLNAYKQNGGN